MQDNLKFIHFDMKGFPPTPERILKLVPMIKHSGFSGILYEFADMFPWEFDRRFRNETCFPEEVISGIGTVMRNHDMRLGIYLDLFRSMEFMLGIGSYRYLAFTETGFERINPSSVGSRNFVEGLMDEVFALLPEVEYFCIGGFSSFQDGIIYNSQQGDVTSSSFLSDLKSYVEDHDAGFMVGEAAVPLSERDSPLWESSIVREVPPDTEASGIPVTPGWKAVNVEGIHDENAFVERIRAASRYLHYDRIILMFPTRRTHHAPQSVPFEILLPTLQDIPHRKEIFEVHFWELYRCVGAVWEDIRSARELLTLITRDGRRRYGHTNDIRMLTAALSDRIDRAYDRGEQFVSSMKGFCDEYWMKIFIRDLLEPASEELHLIRARIPSVTE